MEYPDEKHIGRFYGVYLLCSQSNESRYKGKCYIGFTVNPNRRINQHNRGKDFGGARKTNNKGPWKMVLIVHGFPNNIAALQFEWAWQQPMHSARLKNFAELTRKLPRESYFQYNFRIVSRMLNIGPWQRLPLIIRWLEPEFECDFEPNLIPPRHMQIISGRITIAKEPQIKDHEQKPRALWARECHLCMQNISNPESSRIGCLNSFCKLTCHVICLANYFISSDIRNRGHFIPITGECPLCETELSWVALLQLKYKMQGVLNDETNDESDTDDDQSNFDEEDTLEERDYDACSDIENEMEIDVEKYTSRVILHDEVYVLSD